MIHKERAKASVLVIEEEEVSWYSNIMRFLELGVKEVEVFGDSTLVIAQALKLWKVMEEHLKPYQ